jgi:integrase
VLDDQAKCADVDRAAGQLQAESVDDRLCGLVGRAVADGDDGLAVASDGYTVAQAVTDWLAHGLNGRDPSTITTCTILSSTHIVPVLGTRKLRSLRAEDVDEWLAAKAQTLSTATLQKLHSCLNRAIKRAMARDKVRRNVVALCAVPQGQSGRPSKALTMAQAETVLTAAAGTRMHAYIVVSLLTGARTEELRALTWDHVHLVGQPARSAVYGSVALGSGRGRHQDPQVPLHPRPARPVRRCTAGAARAAAARADHCWSTARRS